MARSATAAEPAGRDRRPAVLVCGSNWGRAYVAALALGRRRYRLAGILARGSERSRALARGLGLPLYRRPDRLPDGIDLACAALSGDAFPVVLELLERGIHVLCDHPQRPERVRAALERARRHHASFHLNAHLGDLPAPQAFVAAARARRRRGRPLRLDLLVADRALYGALDVVARALGAAAPARLRRSGRRGPFVSLEGSLAAVEATVRVQTASAGGRALADASPGYQVDLRLDAVWPEGTLTLLGLGGPVLWSPNPRRRRRPGLSLWRRLDRGRPTAAGLSRARLEANLAALDRLLGRARGGPVPPEQRPPHLLGVSRAWARAGRLLGGS